MTVRVFDTPNTGQEIKTKPGGNQAIAAGTFLLRRRPRYPKSPKPLANSAKAPGKGVGIGALSGRLMMPWIASFAQVMAQAIEKLLPKVPPSLMMKLSR